MKTNIFKYFPITEKEIDNFMSVKITSKDKPPKGSFKKILKEIKLMEGK